MNFRMTVNSAKFLLCTIFVFYSSSLYPQNVESVLQLGHYAPIKTVVYSNSGKFIATGSEDNSIKLWQNNDGKEIRAYTGSNSSILSISFNVQETQLISVDANGHAIIWDINTGEIIQKLFLPDDKIICAAFSPSGLQVVTGSEKSHIAIWDITSGKLTAQVKATPYKSNYWGIMEYEKSKTVSYSKNGEYIVAGTSDNTAFIWDAKTLKELKRFHVSHTSCGGCYEEAIITPDNKYLVSAYSDSIQIFEINSGKLVDGIAQNGSLSDLKVSNDNSYIAVIQYGKAIVLDKKTKRIVFQTKKTNSTSLDFSPDSKKLVVGNEARTAEVFDIASGKNILSLTGSLSRIDERFLKMYWASLVNEAKLSNDGKYIAVGRTGNNAKLIDFKTGKIHKKLTGHNSSVISLCFSKDSKYIVTAGLDGKAILWDVETGNHIRDFNFRDSTLTIFSVDISDNNKLLATADWAGYVVIWDLETGKAINELFPHNGAAAFHVKFSHNGLYIISAGLDQKLKMFEVDSKEEVRTFKGHTGLVHSIDFDSTTNKIITSSWDNTIRVWDFYSGMQTLKIKAHNNGVYCARFDPSGKYIISGGDDYLAKLWDASTGNLISTFKGHKGGVGDVCTTSDNKYLLSGSRDGSIRVWNLTTQKELVSLTFLNEDDWFIKTPEGYFDASEGAYSSISFVKGTTLYSIEQFFNNFYRPGVYAEALNSNVQAFRDNIFNSIEKSPPPTVEFVSPDVNSNYDKDMVTCMVNITNNGGGVKELKVMHNGKRIVVDDSDLKRMKKAGQSSMKIFDVSLLPGENEIRVSAYSEGEIESKETSTKLYYKGIQKTSDCYLVSIGINKYENEDLNLNYARSDAQAVTKLINEKSARLFKKMFTYQILDKEATKEKILTTLDEIAKTIKKEDVFVFFYAGHGSTVDNLFYFIPTSCLGLYQLDKLEKAIDVKTLQEKFKSIAALKQVVFVDACHSGTSVDLLASRGAVEEKALAQLSRSTGIHVMASSESQQLSAEVQSLGHGVFTYTLLEALNGKADGAPKDSKVTVYEIKSFIDDQVPDISYRLIHHKQFPSTFSVGHDFPLVTE